MAAERLSFSKRIGFSIALVVLLFGALELGARALYALRTPLLALVGRSPRDPGDLAPYKMPDPRHPGLWIHRPGFTMTYAELVGFKRSQGRFVSLASIEATAAHHQIRPDDVVLRINQQGFKGHELDPSRTRPRLVTIGDSCTAGTQLDYFTYSRSLERELARLGVPVEVVNGGVEGYVPADVLMRIDDFTVLAPNWTVLYVGWNALFDDKEWQSFVERHWATGRLARRLFGILGPTRSRRDMALEAFTKPKHPVLDAPEVAARNDFVPTFFDDIPQIIERMQSTDSRVALVTLPGLYTTHEAPTPEALKIGHMPENTDNPYVFAKMTERYNDLLRALAAERGLVLIDLERWAERTLVPRHEWFVDSVHLTEEGQTAIGIYMAAQLAPEIRAQDAAAGARDR